MNLPPVDRKTVALVAAGVVGGYALWRFLQGPSFGSVALAQAKEDLGVTQSGDPSRVLQMLQTYGITSMANWCAAAVGTWIHQAAAAKSVAPPIAGSAGAKNTMEQLQDPSNPEVGWLDVAQIRAANGSNIEPGMVVIWQRGPAGSWMGHIGIVSANLGGGNFKSVEGNAGATGGAVVESTHAISSTALLGMGYFQDGHLQKVPAGARVLMPPPDAPQGFMPVAGVEPVDGE